MCLVSALRAPKDGPDRLLTGSGVQALKSLLIGIWRAIWFNAPLLCELVRDVAGLLDTVRLSSLLIIILTIAVFIHSTLCA